MKTTIDSSSFAVAAILVFGIAASSAHPKIQKTDMLNEQQLHVSRNGSFYRFARCFDHLNPKQKADLEAKNGIIGNEYRWPGGVVLYTWHSSTNNIDRATIREGMQMIEDVTCIRFKERTTEENYVIIQTDDPEGGCFSTDIGMSGGGSQILNLARNGCDTASTAAHELIHVIGFYHEQSRLDRDDYIDIFWDNIQKDSWSQFETYPSETFGVRYNVKSLMHYEAYNSMAINENLPTMASKDPNNPIPKTQAEQTQVMDTDAEKINLMYQKYC